MAFDGVIMKLNYVVVLFTVSLLAFSGCNERNAQRRQLKKQKDQITKPGDTTAQNPFVTEEASAKTLAEAIVDVDTSLDGLNDRGCEVDIQETQGTGVAADYKTLIECSHKISLDDLKEDIKQLILLSKRSQRVVELSSTADENKKFKSLGEKAKESSDTLIKKYKEVATNEVQKNIAKQIQETLLGIESNEVFKDYGCQFKEDESKKDIKIFACKLMTDCEYLSSSDKLSEAIDNQINLLGFSEVSLNASNLKQVETILNAFKAQKEEMNKKSEEIKKKITENASLCADSIVDSNQPAEAINPAN